MFKSFQITGIALLFIGSIYAQTKELHIEYDFYFKNYYPELREINVTATHKNSLSTVKRTIKYKSYGSSTFEPKSYYTNYFKTKDSIIYEEQIDDELYIIGEPLNQFKWKLTGNSKTVLGYKCSEARTSYRGREYVAYFTTEIPFNCAPWKFHGLPGVLLQVTSVDNQTQIEAKSLKIKELNTSLKYPFNSSDIISWDDFKKEYVKSWKLFKNKTMSQLSLMPGRGTSGQNSKIKPGLRMELLVEGNGGAEKTDDTTN
jgi:GLPGLI family protein